MHIWPAAGLEDLFVKLFRQFSGRLAAGNAGHDLFVFTAVVFVLIVFGAAHVRISGVSLMNHIFAGTLCISGTN